MFKSIKEIRPALIAVALFSLIGAACAVGFIHVPHMVNSAILGRK